MAPPIDNNIAVGVLAGVTMVTAGTSSEVSAASFTQGPNDYSINVSNEGGESFIDFEFVNFNGFSEVGTLTSVLLDHDKTFAAGGDSSATVEFSLNQNQALDFAELDVGGGEADVFQIDLLEAFPTFDFSNNFQVFVLANLDDGTDVSTSGGPGISVTFVTADIPLPGAAIGLLTGVAGLAGVSLLRRRRD